MPGFEPGPQSTALDAWGFPRIHAASYTTWSCTYCWLQFVYVFAGTRFNSAFSDYVPDKVVFKGFQEGVVTEIMNKQEEKVELNLRLFDR